MATTTINATYQGEVQHSVTSALNWSTVRNASTGTFADTYTSNITRAAAIRASRLSLGRTQTRTIVRTYLFFDLSSVSGTITDLTLRVLGGGGNEIGVIVIKSTAWGGSGGTSTLATTDFGNADFTTSYLSGVNPTTWNTTGYNVYDIGNAVSDANTNGYINCALVETTYDYGNTDPTLGSYVDAGVEFLDPSNPIKVDVTYTPAGYGNNVIGVGADSIDNVIGVATADIGNIIGV